MATSSVLFDIDGTLIDSNFLHIDAWSQAFQELSLVVPSWRIQTAIGADSTDLLDMLIGDEPEQTKTRVKELHAQRYQDLMPRLRLLDSARELLQAIYARGPRIVLATSAPQQELDELLTVLDSDKYLYAVTSAEDVEKAKPAPDIVAVALQKGGVEAGSAMMIGDSTWDILAATRAGVRTIAVLTGGTGAADLREAGAIAVYDGMDDLLTRLDSSPLAELWERDRP